MLCQQCQREVLAPADACECTRTFPRQPLGEFVLHPQELAIAAQLKPQGIVVKEIDKVFLAEEKRVVDPKTGGEKGQKDAQLSTLPAIALMEVAKIGGFGAKKYARYNYLKGYAWSLSYDGLQRHVHEFWMGNERDYCPKGCEYSDGTDTSTCKNHSGLLHMAHAAWHCLALIAFTMLNLGTDDRYKGNPNANV